MAFSINCMHQHDQLSIGFSVPFAIPHYILVTVEVSRNVNQLFATLRQFTKFFLAQLQQKPTNEIS